MPFALTRLPTVLLRQIACTLGHCSLVVAFTSRDLAVARRAIRDGVDDSERARLPGAALTVREAETLLLEKFPLCRDYLDDPKDLGEKLYDTIDGLTDLPDLGSQEIDSFFRDGHFSAFLVLRADPDARGECDCQGMLHLLASYAPPCSIHMARQLLAAGIDIDMRCNPPNEAGLSALSWAVTVHEANNRFGNKISHVKNAFKLASYLIEQGCDVVQSNSDYRTQSLDTGLVEYLDRQNWPALGDAELTSIVSELRGKLVNALQSDRGNER